MEIRIVYFALFILMLIGLYYGGKGIKKENSLLVAVGVIAFALNEGLRFGRWIDYNNYYFFYHEALHAGQTRFDEPLFVFLCRIINAVGGEFQWLIIFISFMHIFAAVFFLRLYKEVAIFALPLFAIFSYFSAENLIRWYLGFSFILIGLYYLISFNHGPKRLFLFFLFCFIALNVHFGLILVIPLVYGINCIKRHTLHPYISISLYILFVIFFQTDLLLFFSDYLNTLSFFGGRFGQYADNSEYWLTTYALGLEKKSSFLGLNVTALYFLCVIVGYRLARLADRKYMFAYNMFIFGFLLNPIAARVELLSRIDELFILFISVIIAYLLKHLISQETFSIQRYKLLRIISIVILLNFGRVQVFQIFNRNPDTMLYVWNKDGREYLDNYSVYFKQMYKSVK